jgi:hypothetical protein
LSHTLLILVGFFWAASIVMIFQGLGFRCRLARSSR